jgi:dGTPase
MARRKAELESLLRDRVYRHPDVMAVRREAQQALAETFAAYLRRPELLPEAPLSRVPQHGLARTVADYLAGMTDRYALAQARAICG